MVFKQIDVLYLAAPSCSWQAQKVMKKIREELNNKLAPERANRLFLDICFFFSLTAAQCAENIFSALHEGIRRGR